MTDRLHRRTFVQLAAAAAAALVPARLRAQPAGQDRWSDPPDRETPEVAASIAAALEALRGGASTSSVLCDPRFASLHPYPGFRAAIKAHATSTPLTIVAKDEPGERARTIRASPPSGGRGRCRPASRSAIR